MNTVKIAIMLMLFGRENLLPMSEARVAISRMNRQIQSAGVQVVVKKTARQRRDPCQRFNMVSQRYGKYVCMKQWAFAHGYMRPRRLFSALIPITDDGYSYGFASGTCDLSYGFTMSTFGRVNIYGQDRTEFSRIALIHELGHLLGAKHEDGSCNVMNADALRCIEPTYILDFEPRSLLRMMMCTN